MRPAGRRYHYHASIRQHDNFERYGLMLNMSQFANPAGSIADSRRDDIRNFSLILDFFYVFRYIRKSGKAI